MLLQQLLLRRVECKKEHDVLKNVYENNQSIHKGTLPTFTWKNMTENPQSKIRVGIRSRELQNA
jgi:hypothetical protein